MGAVKNGRMQCLHLSSRHLQSQKQSTVWEKNQRKNKKKKMTGKVFLFFKASKRCPEVSDY